MKNSPEETVFGLLLSPSRALVGAVVVTGLIVLGQVRFHWGGESYYNFGWFVPFLGAYLFVRRMEDAPRPSPPSRRVVTFLFAVGTLLIVALLPFQLLSEVNPFWRAPLILQAGLVFLLGFVSLGILGGWGTVRHFAFPAVFLLTMIPLPWRIETEIIQMLTRQVVEATVLVLNLVGYNASVRGAVIVIDGNTVGVDDACSGIRSLQVLGMVTLFLSDYFRISWGRRAVLFAIAFVVVMLFNSLRSLALTLIVVHGGYEAYDRFHDWVGILSFAGCIAVLYGVCEWIRSGKPRPPDRAVRGGGDAATETAPSHGFAGPVVWVVAALSVFAAKEAWFRLHEERARPDVVWTVEWPDQRRLPYRFADIPRQVSETLTYDFGDRIQGVLPGGQYIDLYFYGYTGENRMNAVTSYGHQPTVCMTAIGARLLDRFEPMVYERDGIALLVQHYTFLTPTATEPVEMHVFYTIWERRNMGLDPRRMETIGWRNQFELMRRGRRDYARQILLVGMVNAPSPEAARRSVESLLGEIVVVKPFED